MKMRTTLLKAADESVDNTMTEELGSFKQDTRNDGGRARQGSTLTQFVALDLPLATRVHTCIPGTKKHSRAIRAFCSTFLPHSVFGLGPLTVKSSDPLESTKQLGINTFFCEGHLARTWNPFTNFRIPASVAFVASHIMHSTNKCNGDGVLQRQRLNFTSRCKIHRC